MISANDLQSGFASSVDQQINEVISVAQEDDADEDAGKIKMEKKYDEGDCTRGLLQIVGMISTMISP